MARSRRPRNMVTPGQGRLGRSAALERRAACHDDGRPERPTARQAGISARKDAQYVADRAVRYRPNIARAVVDTAAAGRLPTGRGCGHCDDVDEDEHEDDDIHG